MKRTVILAIAIFLLSVPARSHWLDGYDWKFLMSPRRITMGNCPERINIFAIESLGITGPHFFWIRSGPRVLADIDLSAPAARFKNVDDTSDISQTGNFSYGLCWAVQPWIWTYREPTKDDWPDGYRFEIGATSFTIVKRLGGIERQIAPPTRSSAIKSNFDFKDAKSWNHLRVKKNGAQHTAWINGIQVFQFTDSDLPTGYFAFKSEDGEPSVFSFGVFSVTPAQLAGAWRWMKYE